MSFILLKLPKLILMLPLKQRCPKPSAYKILSVSRFFLGNQKNHQQQQKWKERPREKPLQGAGAAATTQPQPAESRSSLISETYFVLTGTHTHELLGHVQSRKQHRKKKKAFLHSFSKFVQYSHIFNAGIGERRRLQIKV